MWRGLLLSALLLASCQGVNGPFKRKVARERIDNPCLTIPEQERRGRDQIALPDQNPLSGPRTYMEPPGAGVTGR